jgi:hypothetical protein
MAHAKKALARSIAKASFSKIDEGTRVVLLSPDFQGSSYVIQKQTESQASEDVVELRQYPYKEESFTMGYSVSLNTLVFVQPDESSGSWFRR